jgi:hypothetical protein
MPVIVLEIEMRLSPKGYFVNLARVMFSSLPAFVLDMLLLFDPTINAIL